MSAQTHAPAWMPPLQALVENPLRAAPRAHFIGLIGDHPSSYARSPRMWQAALAALGIDAAYLPLDVRADRLAALVEVMRRSEACLGANITAPYKEMIVPMLDGADATAATIGAVNTVVREADGRLVGANTDGIGLVAALLESWDGPPLFDVLTGAVVLLIGAGGAARAAAAALAPMLGSGELLITNRSLDRAEALAALARGLGGRARAVHEDELDAALPAVTLAVNASTRGQAGIHERSFPPGWTVLEPYSAFAPAHPAVLPVERREDYLALWETRSAKDIEANHTISRQRIRLLPPHAVIYDMIYAPPETVTLRHAREAGLRAANGRGMNIAQAVAACIDHICQRHLAQRGIHPGAARAQVAELMAGAWSG